MSGEIKTEGDREVIAWLVDDSATMRELMPSVLGTGYGIRFEKVFATPAQVMAAVRESTPPNVILLDVNLRQESGIDYVRPLRESAPDTRVVMITTFFDSYRETEALAQGASGFILKTSSVESMTRVIREAAQATAPEPELACAKEIFSQVGEVEIARSEPAVRGFRPPTGHPLQHAWAGLRRWWRFATARAARLGMHF